MEEFRALAVLNASSLNEENYAKARKKCSKIVQNSNNSNFDEAVCDICLEGDEDELPNGDPDRLVI